MCLLSCFGRKIAQEFLALDGLALAGAYFVSFPDLNHNYEGEAFNPNTIGVLLALTAAMLWGASTVFGKYVLRTVAFQTLTSLRFVIAFVFLAILNVTQDTLPVIGSVTQKDWLFIVIVALTSGVFSLFLYYYGLQFTNASIATIAELGFPLAAVVVNAYFIVQAPIPGAFFGLETGQWIGTALLLFAMLMLSRVNRLETENVVAR